VAACCIVWVYVAENVPGCGCVSCVECLYEMHGATIKIVNAQQTTHDTHP